MRSARRGKNTSGLEIRRVLDGIELRIDGEAHTLPYSQFPWFRAATEAQLNDVERPTASHLRWPRLDVDLSVDSIRFPERYPLVSGSS